MNAPVAPVGASANPNDHRIDRVVQFIGWTGAISVLAAFFLTSLLKFPVDGPVALMLNIYGGTTIAMASWRRRAFQSVFVNVIWTGIGLGALARSIFF